VILYLKGSSLGPEDPSGKVSLVDQSKLHSSFPKRFLPRTVEADIEPPSTARNLTTKKKNKIKNKTIPKPVYTTKHSQKIKRENPPWKTQNKKLTKRVISETSSGFAINSFPDLG
jgi:hypothetical protein